MGESIKDVLANKRCLLVAMNCASNASHYRLFTIWIRGQARRSCGREAI